MIRTNGKPRASGTCIAYHKLPYGCAYSAFQIGIDVEDERDVDFVYWMLRVPAIQGRISQEASGTTGLGNVAVGWLRELELPWPGTPDRERATPRVSTLPRQRGASMRSTARQP